MGILKDITDSYKKTLQIYGFNQRVVKSSSYILCENDNTLFSFSLIDNNLKNVKRYITHVHKCNIDNIQYLNNNDLILFSVIDENLKASTLLLKKM